MFLVEGQEYRGMMMEVKIVQLDHLYLSLIIPGGLLEKAHHASYNKGKRKLHISMFF
jgi:hypothetical protein